MSDILSIVLSSIHADMARADRAAMNLANSQTPGYKREAAPPAPFAGQWNLAAARLEPGAGSERPVARTDLRAGTLRSTGHPLDLALSGDGWFEVATESGLAYTRQGNFRLDAAGRLVTAQGHAVMGTSGVIQLLRGSPSIDAAGRVFEDHHASEGLGSMTPAPVAQLRIVQFEPGADLRRLGDGLLAPSREPVAAAEGAVQVQQGFLENSNVAPMREMVDLMLAVRHLETMQKVASGYDEMLGASIRRLGET